MRKGITIVIMLVLFALSYLSAQNSSEEYLLKTWYLDTYLVGGGEYAPEAKEQDDFVQFNEDATFVSQSEAVIEKGTWIPNNSGGYLELTDESGQTFKVYIISITEDVLILRYDIPEISDIEVRYLSKKN